MDKQFNYEIIDNYLPNNVSSEIENIMLKNILEQMVLRLVDYIVIIFV
jgi:hypothetical protein